MRDFYKIDVEMLNRTKNLIDELEQSNLLVSEKNELEFVKRYIKGLSQRIQNNIEAGRGDVLSSNI